MPATAAPRAQSVKVSGVVRTSSVQRWVSNGPGRSRSAIVSCRAGESVKAATSSPPSTMQVVWSAPANDADDVSERPGGVVEPTGGGRVAAGSGPDQVVRG